MAAEKPLPHARCNRARIRSLAKTHSELRQASGHDFSRADKDQTMCRALAPAGFPAAPPRVCANSTHIYIDRVMELMRRRRRQFSLSDGSGLTHGFNQFTGHVLAFYDLILPTFAAALSIAANGISSLVHLFDRRTLLANEPEGKSRVEIGA